MHDQCRLAADVGHGRITQQPASRQVAETLIEHQVAVPPHQVYLTVVPATLPQDTEHLRDGRSAFVIACPEILKQVAEYVHSACLARRAVEELPE